MRKPFDNEFPITQQYNDICCQANYAQFGMKGHNGLDFGCPTGTKILSPHDGKIIEATLDAAGYGVYVKIENSIEGSVLAHLREYRVGVGDGVKEGDCIGYSDNSGNSTGPHLHWGYYRFPRDRQNGFAGFIDQTPYITESVTVVVESKIFENLVRKSTLYDWILEKLNIQDVETIVKETIQMFSNLAESLRLEQKKNEQAILDITTLRDDAKKQQIKYDTLKTKVERVLKEVNIAIDDNTDVLGALDELEKKVTKPIEKPWYIKMLEFFKK